MQNVESPNPQNYFKGRIPELLGVVTIAWSQLEYNMQWLLMELANVNNKAGLILTRKQGVEVWKEHIILLVNLRITDEQALADLTDLIIAITAAQAKRNTLTHSLYGLSDSPGTIGRLRIKQKGRKTKKRLEPESAIISTKELRETIDEIHAASDAVMSFLHTYVRALISNKSPLPPLS